MAYDKQKAHEYYIKYRKKGLLKGRKKGKNTEKSSKAKKAKQESLLGVSSSGLNEQGKIEAALIKDDMKKQMNAALSKATSDEERQQIKREYSLKAVQAINDLKNNSNYAQAKKTKETKEKTTKEKTAKESTSKEKKVSEKEVERLNKTIKDLSSKVEQLTKQQEEQVKTILADILKQMKNQVKIDKRL